MREPVRSRDSGICESSTDDPRVFIVHRPIFVVGTQRSGTTLLQSLLGSHPNIAAPPETYFLFRVANLAAYFGDLTVDANLRRALHESLNPPIGLFAGCGFDEETLFDRARESERSYAALLDVILTDFATRQHKERWSEKTPNQLASAVLRVFPAAQIIHIIRDPRDVVASTLETPWEERSARQVAAWWRAFVLDAIRIGRQVGPSQFLQVRYEDLTSEPEAVMRLACAFLREDYDPTMIESRDRRAATIAVAAVPWQSRVLDPITAERQGRASTTMSRVKAASVAAVVHAALPPLGYTPANARAVVAGNLINAALLPAGLADRVRRVRLRRRLRTPEDRYRETKRFMARVSATVPAGQQRLRT
jgi:Sulfotransferase family